MAATISGNLPVWKRPHVFEQCFEISQRLYFALSGDEI